MIRRLGLSTISLLVGAAISGGLYWGFLNTPESTGGALVLSVLLIVVTAMLVAITVLGALELWATGFSAGIFRQSASRIAAIVPAILLIVATWWMVGRATRWIDVHSGEISAWFIARFGWANVSWLFTSITWIARWTRWIFAPVLALSLLAAVVGAGWRSLAGAAWIRSAVSPRRLVLATLWFAVLVAVPWVYLAPWRPRGIPPNWIELLFITAKLSVTFVLMAIGTSLMIREVARNGQPFGRS